jgi:hypothetical protein
MALDHEQIVRQAYKVAEEMDIAGLVAAFTEDGTFTDESIGVTWKGPAELPQQVENYHRAFPDMHRELFRFYVSARSSGSTATPKARSSSPSSACSATSAPRWGTDRHASARPPLPLAGCGSLRGRIRQGVTTSLRDAPVLSCSQVPLMSSSRVCFRSMVNLPSIAWPASCA